MNATQQKNNLGQFYTNLGKTMNTIKNNTKNVSSIIPLSNITTANVQNNVPKTFNKWFWPLIIFISIAIVTILLLLKFKNEIETGINNLGQKIRDFFNKDTKPLSDGQQATNVTEVPIPPQDEMTATLNRDIIDKIIPSGRSEVFNISNNEYSYYDAEPLCKALGTELATYDQVKEAWSKGADWCNYGWVKGQAAVYPTQENTWNKLQSGHDDNKGSCGVPGLNGGYFDNPEMKFGVNCYGVKPAQSENDQENLMKQGKIPSTVPALEYDRKVQKYKSNRNNIGVLPFNENKWSS